MLTLTIDSELMLQAFQTYHAEELFRLVDDNREHLRRWLPWVDDMVFPGQFQSVIRAWEQHFYEKKGYFLAIRYKGELAGTISLHGIDWIHSQTSIGYYLAKKMEGKGIMHRAARTAIGLAFYHLGLNRIEIRCGRGNLKSQAIPLKLGFKPEGIIRDGEFLNGNFHDLFVYGMLAREWHSNQSEGRFRL